MQICMCPGIACGGSLCNWIVAYRGGCTDHWEHSGTGFSSPYWLHKDACGLTTAFMTYFLIYGAMYIVNTVVIYPWMGFTPAGILHSCAFTTIMGLAAISHWRAMTSDPGAVPKNAQPLPSHAQALAATNRAMRKCHVSGIFKPMRAHFDREIQRCVVKMDHHCPWVNNCIGIANQKLFILFVAYVAIGSFYALLLVLGRYVVCTGKPEEHASFCSHVTAADRVLVVLLCIEAVLFGLFTTCMACEQVTSVMYNQTYIDRLQARRGDAVKSTNHGVLGNLREVFGDTDSYLNWLLPTLASWKDRDEIMGYTVPVSEDLESGYLLSTQPSEDQNPLSGVEMQTMPSEGSGPDQEAGMVEVNLESPKNSSTGPALRQSTHREIQERVANAMRGTSLDPGGSKGSL